jgi:hypothetical protein
LVTVSLLNILEMDVFGTFNIDSRLTLQSLDTLQLCQQCMMVSVTPTLLPSLRINLFIRFWSFWWG